MAEPYVVVLPSTIDVDRLDLPDELAHLGPWQVVGDRLLLVHSEHTQSEVYHEVKWRLPDDAPLFVGRLAEVPKMKGQARGSVRWAREHPPET